MNIAQATISGYDELARTLLHFASSALRMASKMAEKRGHARRGRSRGGLSASAGGEMNGSSAQIFLSMRRSGTSHISATSTIQRARRRADRKRERDAGQVQHGRDLAFEVAAEACASAESRP